MDVQIGGFIVAISAVIVPIMIAIIQHSISKNEKIDPKVTDIIVDFSKFQVFHESGVRFSSSKAKNINSIKYNLKNYSELVNPKNFSQNIIFNYEQENHNLINLIEENTKEDIINTSLVVAFNALRGELRFCKNVVSEIALENGYTVNGTTYVSNNMELNVRYVLTNEECENGKITLPFSYVFIKGHPVNTLINELLSRQENKKYKSEQESVLKTNDENLLGFDESGYILKITTCNSNRPIYYSFVISIKEGKINLYPIRRGKHFFYKSAKAKEKKLGKKIVQKPTPFWRNKR